jgi:hypothetical protein
MILLFFAMTAQELNLIQLARVAAIIADNIKYWSRSGRIEACFIISLASVLGIKFLISGSVIV